MKEKSFLYNTRYMASVLISAFLAFGYQLTHSSLGIDDINLALDYSKEVGIGPSRGRWPFYVLANTFNFEGLSSFVPFISDAVAVLLFVAAAVIWADFLKKTLKSVDIIPGDFPFIIFSCIFVSYSLVSHIWIYSLHNGVALAFALLGITMSVLSRTFVKTGLKEQLINLIIAILLITLSISLYESMIAVLFLGLGIYLFIIYFPKEKFSFEPLLRVIVNSGIAILVGMELRNLITLIVCKIYGIGSFYGGASLLSTFLGFFKNPNQMISSILCNYFLLPEYQPIRLFMLLCLFDAVFIVVDALKNRRIRMILIALYCVLSMFSFAPLLRLALMTQQMPYRMMQAMNLFVAVSLFLFAVVLCKKIDFKRPTWILCIIPYIILVIIFWNNFNEINYDFFMEYENYEASMRKVDNIGYDLYRMGYNVDEHKTVFLGKDSLGTPYPLEQDAIRENSFWDKARNTVSSTLHSDNYIVGSSYYQTVANNVFSWALDAFGDQEQMKAFFEREGYPIDLYEIWLVDDETKALAEKMPVYPEDGYIFKVGDVFVVNCGK